MEKRDEVCGPMVGDLGICLASGQAMFEVSSQI